MEVGLDEGVKGQEINENAMLKSSLKQSTRLSQETRQSSTNTNSKISICVIRSRRPPCLDSTGSKRKENATNFFSYKPMR